MPMASYVGKDYIYVSHRRANELCLIYALDYHNGHRYIVRGFFFAHDPVCQRTKKK